MIFTVQELVEIVAALASAVSNDAYRHALPADNRRSLHAAYKKSKQALAAAQKDAQ